MTPTADDDFRPSWWLRSPHLQSMLASSSLRRALRGKRARRLERDAEWVTLDCGDGVRLTGCRTAQDVAPLMYHDYFMWKWRRSLKAKQRAFVDAELFTRHDLRGTLRTLTEALVLKHTDFGSLDNYLDGYSVAGDVLAGLRVPTSILATCDDPVCPATDLATMTLPAC